MSSFASESLRLLKRLVRGPGAAPPHAGRLQALDGLTAVAALETRVCDAAGLGASYPASLAARVWDDREASVRLNALNKPLTGIDADSPRSALAGAIGLALAGRRSVFFGTGQDLLSSRDLVAQAAHRHAPLVIHVVLRASAQQGQTLGTGHDALHTLSDLPCMLFVAHSVQEAVDLALIARRCAELALLPAIVAMDCEQTALSVQSVALPDDELVRSYLGSATEVLPPATQAQRVLFGESRRRVPRLYDLETPAMIGALQDPLSFALGSAARRVFFEPELTRLIDESTQAFTAQTGRRAGALLTHQVKGAEAVLLAQGSLVEHAIACANAARVNGQKIGVVGLSRLSPLDAVGLATALGEAETVCVLERCDVSASSDGPLMRLLRASMDRCRENAQHGVNANPGYPAFKRLPRLINAVVGLGGLPVRSCDLAALLAELKSPKRSLYYVGLDFARQSSAYPKHQVLLDTLRRDFPHLAGLGIQAAESVPPMPAPSLMGIAVLRPAGSEGESVAGQIAAFAYAVVGGGLRSRPSLLWQRGGQACEDRFMLGPQAIVDPGDDLPVGVAIVTTADERGIRALADRLADDADVLVPAELLTARAGSLSKLFQSGRRRAHVIDRSAAIDAACRVELLVAASVRVALTRLGAKLPSAGQLRSRREESLLELPENERTLRLDAFVAGFESVAEHDTTSLSARSSGAKPAALRTPGELQELSKSEIGPASLTRFWNHTSLFSHEGADRERVPEPGASLGITPAMSALFHRMDASGDALPTFDPATCDGSPALWMSCPDGSVAPLVIGARALLEAGIDLATRAGAQADALRPLVSQIARRINKLAIAESAPTTAGDLLRTAFSDTSAKSDTPVDRRAAQQAAVDAVIDRIGALPLGVTDVFFRDAERAAPGSGAFLSLVVNPDACKSASLVIARGQGHGLKPVERTPENIEAARKLWSLWQQLPDTSGEIIEKSRQDDRIGPLAAMMLSRHCLHAMTAGDGAEVASGAKLALRQVLAIAEFHGQPRMQRLLGQIEQAQGKLSDRIQSLLAKALPTSDLDALARGLETLGRSEVELADLSSRIDSAVVDGHVDGALLARLVETARGLADLHFRIRRGPMGLGRARAALTIAAGSVAQWAAAFPDNPFAMPTLVDACGEPGGLARGALEGYLRDIVDGFRLMRLAKVELDRPAEAPHAAARLAGMTIADLTSDERELVPPMIVVGDAETLAGRGLSQVIWLLDSGLPIKVVVLNGIGGKADGALSLGAMGSYPPARRYDVALLAALTRQAFVAQTSIAFADHFATSVERALGAPTPALVHVHAPSPERHGFEPTRLFEQAELAVHSRAWPIFTFDPCKPGVFGACFDIAANPAPGQAWARDDASRPITPVHFALTETRFAEQFRPLDSGAPSPTPVHEYLAMEPASRAGCTPTIDRVVGDSKIRLRPLDVLVQDADDRLRLWRTLEELSGEVTPFTQQVRQQAEQAVADEHAAEIDRIKRDYEQKLASARSQYAGEVTATVATRLMELAGYNGGSRN